MKKFTTTALPFKSAVITACVIAAIGLGVAVYFFVDGQASMGGMIAGLSVLLAVVLFFEAKKAAKLILTFEGDRLTLEIPGKNQSYEVFDVPASDFVLMQSPGQKKRNVGDMIIKKTKFSIGNVQNFSEMKAYIAENFPA